ncbi:MAG TPA: hypothetical protein VMX33_06775 [bacterium]|nr:hypothetical protein [bacterium]
MKPSFSEIADTSLLILNTALKPRILWTGLLGLALILSGIMSLAVPFRRGAVLWFPDSRSADGNKARSELRYLYPRSDRAAEAADLVNEMFLGPMNPKSGPIAVPEARVRSAIKGGKTLYIDLDDTLLFGRPNATGIHAEPILQPRQALAYLGRTLHWNYPSMHIVLTVDGLEPSWESPNGINEAKKK